MRLTAKPHMNLLEYTRATRKIGGSLQPQLNPTEYQEAIVFAKWLEMQRNLGKVLEYAHLINEMSLNRKGGQSANYAYLNKMKLQGWRGGVPDYLIVLKDKIVFIELKRCKGGCTSPEQKQWIEAINKAGGYASVCKGAQQAISFVESLL